MYSAGKTKSFAWWYDGMCDVWYEQGLNWDGAFLLPAQGRKQARRSRRLSFIMHRN